jgi:hypothetical protein
VASSSPKYTNPNFDPTALQAFLNQLPSATLA